ncbi:MAG: hypothetical protein HC804_14335, partial [Anaerolineae bacterium]|nr:hypothetical protein [Anaerolineae bacterium]
MDATEFEHKPPTQDPSPAAESVKETAVPAPDNRFQNSIRLVVGMLVLLLLLSTLPGVNWRFLDDRLQTFTTIFLGIFIEAVPFLLAGSLVSGFIAVFVDRDTITRYVPRRAVPAALTGALMGFAFPVCECGVVPVTRRLYQKGLPLPVGIAFLLSAPVINPVVLASTYVAFGLALTIFIKVPSRIGRAGLIIVSAAALVALLTPIFIYYLGLWLIGLLVALAPSNK